MCALGLTHAAVSSDARAEAPKAETPTPVPDQAPDRGTNPILVVGGIVVTEVGVVVGVLLALLSNGRGADADAKLASITQAGRHNVCQTHASECDLIDSDLRGRDALAKGALASFLVAGVAGASTLGYVWLTPNTVGSTGVKVTPTMAVGYGGVSIVGTW